MGCIIEAKILFRHTDYSATFFHPKVTLDQRSGSLVMTLQTIGGSDYYGPVRVSYSTDRGESWSSPELISPLGSQKRNDGVTREGTCDVVPDYHPQTDMVFWTPIKILPTENRKNNFSVMESTVFVTAQETGPNGAG